MLIRALAVDHYRIPLPVPMADATHGTMTHFELVTVRLLDADGAEGVGYTYTTGAGGAAIAGLIGGDLRPALIGAEAEDVARLWQTLWWRLHYGGQGGAAALAISAVDIALWDLKARRAGMPLWRLLGGFDPKVPCYAGGIDLHLSLDELLRQTDDNLGRGFRAIKMKVGRARLSEDVARVQALRRHLGEDFPLMADANMRWRVDEAIRAARAFADQNLVWLEEPTSPDDIAGHARIQREGGIALAAGENWHSLARFTQMIRAEAVSFPEPDVTSCGGISVFLKIAHLAEAHNLPVTSHGAHDVTVHLLAALANRSYLEVHGFGLERFLAAPLSIRDGMAEAPLGPGHGVGFDWPGLAGFRV